MTSDSDRKPQKALLYNASDAVLCLFCKLIVKFINRTKCKRFFKVKHHYPPNVTEWCAPWLSLMLWLWYQLKQECLNLLEILDRTEQENNNKQNRIIRNTTNEYLSNQNLHGYHLSIDQNVNNFVYFKDSPDSLRWENWILHFFSVLQLLTYKRMTLCQI